MLSLMFIYLFVSIFPFIYLGLSHFLQTICIFYKQFTNILAIFEYFFKFQNLTNPLFMGYLPQHCLYFFSLPHELNIPIFMLFIVFIVLFVFIVFRYQVSSVFIVFMLLSVLIVFIYCGLFVDIDHIRSLI